MDKQMAEGWGYFSAGAYDLAASQFSEVAEFTTSGSSEHLRALYGLASVWSLRRPKEDYAKAAQFYNQVLQMAPKSEMAAWSLLGLARLKHLVPVGQSPDLAAVREAYQRVVDSFPNHPAGHEALLLQQSTLAGTLQANDAHSAIARLTEFVTRNPESKFVSQAWALTAHCWQTLDQPNEQLAAEINAASTIEIDPANPKGDFAINLWRIATIAQFAVGDFPTARKYYHRLLNEYPNELRRYFAKLNLAEMDQIEQRLREGRSPLPDRHQPKVASP